MIDALKSFQAAHRPFQGASLVEELCLGIFERIAKSLATRCSLIEQGQESPAKQF